MPLFEETPVFIAHPVVMVTTKLNILGPDIQLFEGEDFWQSKLLFSWLQHILHIEGPENATFWGDSVYYS